MMTFLRKTALVLFLSAIVTPLMLAQEAHPLPQFDKVKVSPRIELVLEEGDQESVRFEFTRIDEEDLNYEVRNGQLLIYLDGAKNIEPKRKVNTNYGRVKESIYADGRVTAYVTFRHVNKMVVKGDENVRVDGSISDETFKLKVFGDSDLSFSQLNTDRLKVKMYGDCSLTIEDGNAERQKFALFGDHLIDTEQLPGRKVKATSFGDSEFRVNAEQLKITALGIADINCHPDTQLKKFVLGESSVRRYNSN